MGQWAAEGHEGACQKLWKGTKGMLDGIQGTKGLFEHVKVYLYIL